jgi:hypothetical protein
LESLFTGEWGKNWDDSLKAEEYFGPITYRKWAANYPWPESWKPFLVPLFDAMKKLASGDNRLLGVCPKIDQA